MEEFILNLDWKFAVVYLVLWLLAEIVIYKSAYIAGRFMTAAKEKRKIEYDAADVRTLGGMQLFCLIDCLAMAIALMVQLLDLNLGESPGVKIWLFCESIFISIALIAAIGIPLTIKRIRDAIRETTTGELR